jgi:hypothetical protein
MCILTLQLILLYKFKVLIKKDDKKLKKVKVIQEKIEDNDIMFSAIAIETKNAYIILLSEGEDNLGTLSVSLPKKTGMIGPPLSSNLLGERNIILARILAERIAKKIKKIVLVSVYIKTLNEKTAAPIFLKMLKKIFPSIDKD